MTSTAQQAIATEQVRMPAAVRATAVLSVRPVARVEASSRAVVLVAAALGTLLLWSIIYLARQPGFETATPAAGVRAAVEGVALSLAWLAALAGACVMVLGGVVAFKETGQ